jgi:hypothetical protein
MEPSMGYGNWCIFGLLLGLAQLLLHGALGLVLFWVVYYRGGFGWRETPQLEFNYHPVLMIAGFIYLVGNGELSIHQPMVPRIVYTEFRHLGRLRLLIRRNDH